MVGVSKIDGKEESGKGQLRGFGKKRTKDNKKSVTNTKGNFGSSREEGDLSKESNETTTVTATLRAHASIKE